MSRFFAVRLELVRPLRAAHSRRDRRGCPIPLSRLGGGQIEPEVEEEAGMGPCSLAASTAGRRSRLTRDFPTYPRTPVASRCARANQTRAPSRSRFESRAAVHEGSVRKATVSRPARRFQITPLVLLQTAMPSPREEDSGVLFGPDRKVPDPGSRPRRKRTWLCR
jgi:hypothetical protein